MNQTGSALLLVMWLVVAISAGAAAVLASARASTWMGSNRVHQVQGEWAADACLELALSRGAPSQIGRTADSIALHDRLWCRYLLRGAPGGGLIATIDGGVGDQLVWRESITMIPSQGRLAMTRRLQDPRARICLQSC
jgi:hypothetical protein